MSSSFIRPPSPTPETESNSEGSETDKPKREVDAVFYVVHGMGSQIEGIGRFKDNLFQLRKSCREVLAEEFADAEEMNVEFIPIEWHSIVHSLDTVDKRMQMISLPTTPVFRQINNDILADVLFFFSCFHGPQVLEIVAGVLNKAHKEFLERNPNFKGIVSLLGHSLGGIVCYDILAHIDDPVEDSGLDAQSISSKRTVPQRKTHYEITYPKLNFRPRFLFTMGSPLSAVMVMRGQSPLSYNLPDDIKYLNIFHLYDPLAYRTEPLIDERYQDISPVLLQRPSSNRNSSMEYYRSLSRLL
ncbi:hypothetical protein HDU76_011102, partial [Blyttiomyces sp. JEL0837]